MGLKMASSIIFVVALALAPGIYSATVQTRDLPAISTFPINIDNEIQVLPGTIEVPVLRPAPLPVAPELRPELIPEVAPELRPELIPEVAPELRPELTPEVEAVVPELISVNPCDACFSYMTELIGQLTETTLPEAHPMPEFEVLPEAHPMPEVEVLPEYETLPESGVLPEIVPLPVPVLPTRPEIRPLPIIF
ncbi:hypothetical protein NQ315_016613 [Exocentrus adspersus]|uniref:Uncharacterized protein n=1 Tax=Exocentrus adspersus TaxID=1586481 RepID=A0AAV8VNX1_9CUCU|nr:hypothetical protein NQ315_016613 [Exocentrus adspersus]